jgi:hypothetical protein
LGTEENVSNSEFYGVYSALIPPRVIDSVEYSGALLFNANPHKRESDPIVASGQLADDPVEFGTGRKKLVMGRAVQFDSVTEVIEGSGTQSTQERRIPILMGGNIAETHEAQRLYSWESGLARRGRLSASRVMPGDVAEWNGRRYTVVATEPFSEAPDEVAWQGDEFLPTVRRVRLAINEVAFEFPDTSGENADASLFLGDGDADGYFADSGLVIINEGTVTTGTRVVFDAAGTDEENAFYYPPDASFPANSASYWVNPSSGEVRLATSCEQFGSVVAANYWWRDLERVFVETETAIVLESDGGSGYVSAGDSLALWGRVTTADFTFSPVILARGDGDWEPGCIEWRLTDYDAGVVVALEWGADGSVTSVVKRATLDGSIEAVSFTASGAKPGALFVVEVAKSGSVLSFATVTTGGTRVEVASIDLGALAQTNTPGVFSVGSYGGNAVRFFGLGGNVEQVKTIYGEDVSAVVSMLVQSQWSGVEYRAEVTVPTSPAISEVVNEGAAEDPLAMTVSNTAGRGHYRRSGGVLTFYSESSGDLIRVTNEADTGTPDKPGEAPRTLGESVNAATVDSEVVAENRWHYRDRVDIHDPIGDFAATEGDEIVFYRTPVFDSEKRPTIAHDEFDGAGDWSTVTSGNYLAAWPEGLVLLKKSYVDGLDDAEAHCWRVSGEMYAQDNEFSERMWNDHWAALNAYDDLFVRTNLDGGVPYAVAGAGSGSGVGPSSVILNDDGEVEEFGGLSRGLSKGFWAALNQKLIDAGASLPNWRFLPGDFGRAYYSQPTGDVSGFTNAALTDPEKLEMTSVLESAFYPGGFGGPNYFGQNGPTITLDRPAPGWNFRARPINVTQLLAALPSRAIIQQAWLEAKFDGMTVDTWSSTIQQDLRRYPNVVYADGLVDVVAELNGAIVTSFRRVGTSVIRDISNAPQPATASGSVSFAAVGRRYRSGSVLVPEGNEGNGRWVNVDASTWQAFGGGGVNTGGAVNSGEWTRVDVTDMVEGMQAQRDSLFAEFYLWPTVGGVSPDIDASGGASYADSLVGSDSFSVSTLSDRFRVTRTMSGQMVEMSGFSVRNLVVQFRMPSGLVDDLTVPVLNRPGVMPAP